MRWMRLYSIKESRKPVWEISLGNQLSLLNADNGQRVELLWEWTPLTIVSSMWDTHSAIAYLDYRNKEDWRPRLYTWNLSPIHLDIDRYTKNNPIVVGIAQEMNIERKSAMMKALDILNIFQDRYYFTTQSMLYRHREYHHIWFRKNLLMTEDKILETRIPDEEQWLILTYNDWNFAESFSHEQKVLFLLHELIVGMKAYQGEQYRSIIDERCSKNERLQEDSSYLSWRSRVLSDCHMQEIMKFMKKNQEVNR